MAPTLRAELKAHCYRSPMHTKLRPNQQAGPSVHQRKQAKLCGKVTPPDDLIFLRPFSRITDTNGDRWVVPKTPRGRPHGTGSIRPQSPCCLAPGLSSTALAECSPDHSMHWPADQKSLPFLCPANGTWYWWVPVCTTSPIFQVYNTSARTTGLVGCARQQLQRVW
jgi:hypothetical protein